MVVIIDALDEAGATAAANGLLSLVAGELTKLPAWVKLLVRLGTGAVTRMR